MRNEIFLRIRRNYDQRHAISGIAEVANRVGRSSAEAGVVGLQVDGLNSIRIYRVLRRNMVVKTARFVKGKNERRVLPTFPRCAAAGGRTVSLSAHYRIDQS